MINLFKLDRCFPIMDEKTWKDEVGHFVRLIALAKRKFTTDDVWEKIEQSSLETPREPRIMGPVMMEAKKDGICTQTDEFKRSTRVNHNHGRPLRIWSSRIFGGLRF